MTELQFKGDMARYVNNKGRQLETHYRLTATSEENSRGTKSDKGVMLIPEASTNISNVWTYAVKCGAVILGVATTKMAVYFHLITLPKDF